ncbi:MAG: DUF5024 domain-containing protein [Alistipes sp.]|nr:DUF5024 domain-containing protein [Alistipes sp.]
MKKLLVFVMLLVATIAESQAQEHIDALLNGDIESNRHGLTMRSAVKRDPATGEIIKRVVELTAIDDKRLVKEFIAAFKLDRNTAEAWDENESGQTYNVTAVWLNPKRIYTLTASGSLVVTVYAQTIYREEKNNNN